MILFYARMSMDQIEEKEYVRVTSKYAICTNGRKEALDTEGSALRNTRQEAYEWKRDKLNDVTKGLERQLGNARKKLFDWVSREG